MKSAIQDIVERVELVERIVGRLSAIRERLPSGCGPEERGWLAAAETRLAERLALGRAALEAGLALPELKSLRAERQQRLEQEWVSGLREQFSALVSEVGATSPLIEALYPHQRFEKLDKGGAALRSYRADFAFRRGSAYVRRLAADPDYPFLSPLLTRLDPLTEALALLAPAEDMAEEAAETLRAPIIEAGEALARSFRQARSLSEAALLEHPELFSELAFDERPRKRSARPSAEQPVE